MLRDLQYLAGSLSISHDFPCYKGLLVSGKTLKH